MSIVDIQRIKLSMWNKISLLSHVFNIVTINISSIFYFISNKYFIVVSPHFIDKKT